MPNYLAQCLRLDWHAGVPLDNPPIPSRSRSLSTRDGRIVSSTVCKACIITLVYLLVWWYDTGRFALNLSVDRSVRWLISLRPLVYIHPLLVLVGYIKPSRNMVRMPPSQAGGKRQWLSRCFIPMDKDKARSNTLVAFFLKDSGFINIQRSSDITLDQQQIPASISPLINQVCWV